MGKILRTLGTLACALAASGASGCGRPDGSTLTVATSWPLAERQRVETQFRRSEGASIRWILLAPGDDVVRLANRRLGPDVILGVSTATLARLGRAGLINWQGVARRSTGEIVSPADNTPMPVDDPRRDPSTLARARDALGAGDWAGGYARLVREADRTSRCWGRDRTAAVEWASVVATAPNVSLARAFIWDVARNDPGVPSDEPNPEADALLADLLGATLVDAGDELSTARVALAKAGHPDKAERWLVQAPPWPPASVETLLEGESSPMEMVNTLASQLAPDAAVRSWLVRSWLSPPRQVDGKLLVELAGAADGKLVREPRFRAWLRGEWRAWARQRYRRVARLAAEKGVS